MSGDRIAIASSIRPFLMILQRLLLLCQHTLQFSLNNIQWMQISDPRNPSRRFGTRSPKTKLFKWQTTNSRHSTLRPVITTVLIFIQQFTLGSQYFTISLLVLLCPMRVDLIITRHYCISRCCCVHT
jgi:hypothetical protein